MHWLREINLGRCVLRRASLPHSVDTMIFKRGMDAYNNPAFYRQLGQEPDHVVTQALKTLPSEI
jgi:hypothetical protein